MIDAISVGLASTLALAGPSEWLVHKYILHSKTRTSDFIKKSSIAHNDEHHGAYMAPHHYYRDVTNDHVTVHFGTNDVAIIAGVGAGIGGILSISPMSTVGLVAGSTVGSMIAYGLYEGFHHYMHVVGERRLKIGRVFGDYAEGERTGNLRLPKPTLDSLCNTIDDRVEGKERDFKFKDNCEKVLQEQGIEKSVEELLEYTTITLQDWESKHLENLTSKQNKKYHKERKIHRYLRNSSIFEKLDNHHFLHHKSYNRNLNVVWKWWDDLIGTTIDSSIETLLEDKKYWLCPNSFDDKKFELKQ